MIVVSAFISVLVDLMATYGGYKQYYFMTITYVILMSISALGSIYIAVKTRAYFASILHFLMLGLAYDMRMIRDRAFRFEQFNTSLIPPTMVQVVSCQQYSPFTLESPEKPDNRITIEPGLHHRNAVAALPPY